MNSILRNFLVFSISTLIFCFFISWSNGKDVKRQFYQISIYHFETNKQEVLLDNYFQNALLPALHRMGLKNIGVFKSYANDTTIDKRIFILIPLSKIEQVVDIPSKLASDKSYLESGNSFINTPYDAPAFVRMESIVLQAFRKAPEFETPKLSGPRNKRIYELRSYESASEKIFQNKVHMFNEGDEVGLFKRLNFNAAFYGEVISGSKMPNLMYMTCHENKEIRDANWKAFTTDPFWKNLSSRAEYQHNVSHIDINFLFPTDYSDF